MLDGSGTVVQHACASVADGEKSLYTGLGTALPPHALQALPEGHCDGPGHGLTGQLRQLTGQPARLLVLDAETHRIQSIQVDLQSISPLHAVSAPWANSTWGTVSCSLILARGHGRDGHAVPSVAKTSRYRTRWDSRC